VERGCYLKRHGANHDLYTNPANGRAAIVPIHGNRPIPIGTLKSIVEGAGLAPDDFR